jgi:acetylornithine deacetylase/succinyl-diaminopimelate desuccinylase-like protein
MGIICCLSDRRRRRRRRAPGVDLPRTASATVNCRIIPGVDPQAVQATLERVIDDPGVSIDTLYESVASPPSPLPPAMLERFESLVDGSRPDVPLTPQMSTGGTNGLFLRHAGIPVYGVAGWFIKKDAVHARGLDEKIGIRQLHEGAAFWYRMLKRLSQ